LRSLAPANTCCPGCGLWWQLGRSNGHARICELSGEARSTKHAKFCSWVPASTVGSRLSLPGPRSVPWHTEDMQPGPRPTPPGAFRSSWPDRIGITSLADTPGLNLVTGAQVGFGLLVPAFPLASVIHASSACACIVSTCSDLPLPCRVVAWV